MTKPGSPKAVFAQHSARRGDVCEFCGRNAKPRPGFGKLRYAHQCPHGAPCARGVRLLGNHANWPTCQQCVPYRRAQLAGSSA